MSKDEFYITTPIFYPNGSPHIGHAYTAIATDTVARFHRLDGINTFMLTGTDEHGQKMQQTAEKEGITPIELADKNSAVFQEMMNALGCSHDDFIRTTEDRHKLACQELWRRMAANGDIYLGSYDGWYSVRQEAFFDESETHINEEGVRVEPLGSPVEWVEEESYFFKLSAYEEKLLALYESNANFVMPESRRNEVKSFVKSGLKDLSISRTTFDWGIPVPDNPDHVMYVWVDALTNYVTATGWPSESDTLPNWPTSVHMIGKDIVRFHAVYWPAFLMSAGLPLPKHVFAHGFLFNKGEKMSKSVGNVVDPFDLVNGYGLDQVRFFFLREVPFGNDGSYSHEAIVTRMNSDLANNFGNLAQRSLSMIAKNCEGRVPNPGDLIEEDRVLLSSVYGLLPLVRNHIEKLEIHKYLEMIWKVLGEANRYIDEQAPWALKKTDPERMRTVLWVVAETVRNVAILSQPVMPASCNQLLDLLAIESDSRDFSVLGEAGALKSDVELPKPQGVFPRFVETESTD
ncbi:MAG: methionine--tRNA ligase [Pseudomonadota bacterium]